MNPKPNEAHSACSNEANKPDKTEEAIEKQYCLEIVSRQKIFLWPETVTLKERDEILQRATKRVFHRMDDNDNNDGD